MWLYGQGFPKNAKTQLKPAWEPIILARAPGGVIPLGIDACRIPVLDQKGGPSYASKTGRLVGRERSGCDGFAQRAGDPQDGKGRWPANVVLDGDAAALLDEQSGTLKSGKVTKAYGPVLEHSVALGAKRRDLHPGKVFADAGGASRFFYVSKASRSERTHGGRVENNHRTVKPLALMRWLVRLVAPTGGLVLDPFIGSGTTALACNLERVRCLGIDMEEDHVRIARDRLRHIDEVR